MCGLRGTLQPTLPSPAPCVLKHAPWDVLLRTGHDIMTSNSPLEYFTLFDPLSKPLNM